MIYPESFEHKIGFDAVRSAVAGRCLTAPGRRMVADMGFSVSFEEVSRRIGLTAEMLAIVSGPDPMPLSDLDDDLDTIIAAIRVPGASIEVADLVKLRRMLGIFRDVADYFASHRDGESQRSPFPGLDTTAISLPDFTALRSEIDRTIDKYGNVLDNASPELADIRRQLRGISGTINSIMRKVVARAIAEGYVEADATPTLRDGRLVLPVAPANKRRVAGIVHDESASGKTVFIEPAEVVEANNRVRELEMDERREIARIMSAIVADMRPEADELAAAYLDLGFFDFVRSKALYALDSGASRPSLSKEPEMEWYHACHPVLQATLAAQGKEIVPIDICLTPKQRILIISGPNAGGKSVCLKTVGILQYMLQCGMLPTVYDNSHFGIFEDIFLDIGDDQSIEDDLSTYSSHLRTMKLMLQRGRTTSLTLIDEFGGGTEPQIGGAIAQAILHRFNDRGMWGVITTHFQNLKHYAEDTEGLVNGSMLYDRHLMQPLFRLSIGNPGSSFALEIARKTGLPAEVIDEAGEIVGSDYVNLDKYLLDITRDKRYWENKRAAIRKREKELEATLERYRDEAETLRRSRRDILAEARAEATRIIEGSNGAIERAISEIRHAQAERDRTLEARRQLARDKQELQRESSKLPELLRKAPKAKKERAKSPTAVQTAKAPVEVGSTVRLDGQGTPGRVIEISGKNAVVAFGMIKTTVALSRLQPTNAKIPEASAKGAGFVSSATTDAMRRRQLQFNRDIDVRGMRADEAIQAVTYFLDDAIQFQAGRVRILHGTGTGALRQAIRTYLATVAGVSHFADEDVRLGGAGITVVDLD